MKRFSKKVSAAVKKRQKEVKEASWQPTVTEHSEIYLPKTLSYTCGHTVPFTAVPSPVFKNAVVL